MPRIREIETDGGHPVLQEVFARDRETFGALLNTTKVYAHCPPILEAVKALGAAVEASGQTEPRLRALVCLRVALLNGCPF